MPPTHIASANNPDCFCSCGLRAAASATSSILCSIRSVTLSRRRRTGPLLLPFCARFPDIAWSAVFAGSVCRASSTQKQTDGTWECKSTSVEADQSTMLSTNRLRKVTTCSLQSNSAMPQKTFVWRDRQLISLQRGVKVKGGIKLGAKQRTDQVVGKSETLIPNESSSIGPTQLSRSMTCLTIYIRPSMRVPQGMQERAND